jgi:hypothetical protein
MGGYILELIREDMEKHIESEEYLWCMK